MDLERDLNPQQLEAVTHGEGPQLVLAGAGSGKTRVITHRVAWLVEGLGIDPAAIVAVTFTNKAAAEMRERVEGLVRIEPLPSFVGTFHGFSLRLLRRYGERVGLKHGFLIFDRDDQIRMVKKALQQEGLADSSYPPRSVLAAIGAAKNRLLDPSAFEAEARSFFDQKVAGIYRTYQGLLQKAAGVDFDDMLRLAVALLKGHEDVRQRLRDGIHYLMVDEFQDTNHAQMHLVLELIGAAGNLTAVGDEDQGIYRWRGADLDNVLDFEKYFPEAQVRKLERNYRSTQNILTVAGAVVANNSRRRGKKLWTDSGDGDPVELYRAGDEQDEARWIANTLEQLHDKRRWSEMAVLVRTNAQTRVVEERLLDRRIPYVLVGGLRFYERAEIKDLVAYLRLLRNPQDDFSLGRVINQPPRGIGKATRELLDQSVASSGSTLWDALRHLQPGRFPQRSAKALTGFRDLIVGLSEAAERLALPDLIEKLLEETSYLELYRKEDPESQAKFENIREFVTAIHEFVEEKSHEEDDLLGAFLDHASLVSDIDGWQSDRGVSLMTLHSAKGLEFPAVIVAGLEEGLLPHFNALGGEEDVEEERRLLYVGMTRARRTLFLTCCRRRRIAGRYQDQEQSRFIAEIPEDSLTITDSPDLFASPRTSGVYSFFGRAQPGRSGSSAEPRALSRGRRVRHPTLGDGVVLGSEGDGDASKLTVYFDRVGKRKLVAKYAGLEYL
ncbi:MAG: ATP-dependent helicase [Thermoanaerobaculia bacterium]